MARILVMDDDDIIRSLLKRILEMNGHTVTALPDAAPALNMDFSELDLVVTDLSMPTSGECAIRNVRANRQDLPIVVLSGQVTEERAESLKRLGVQEIIQKPFKLTAFLNVVNGLI